MPEPQWYRRRSAVFALIYAAGFLGGWGISVTVHGRYVAAFTDLGARWGRNGVIAFAIAALCFMVAAFAVRVWGASYLSATTVWDEKAHAEMLLTAGPFAHLRHPLYLGNILLGIGLGAAAPLAGWAFIVIATFIFVQALIRFEERGLAARHGATFQAYAHSVPSLVPKVIGVPAGQQVQPSIRQGLRAESFTGFLLAGVVAVFAVPKYGVALLFACYAAGIVVQRRIERT